MRHLNHFPVSLLLLPFLCGALWLFPDAAEAQVPIPDRLHTDPVFSPNGREIAFSARLEDGKYQVYVADIWGGIPERVSNREFNNYYASWSPRGGHLAYYTDEVTGEGPFPPDTVVYKVRGLHDTYARDGYKPSWSPNGRNLAVHLRSERGNYEIYITDRWGRNRVPLTENYATDIQPKFSPVGEKIVFVSDRDRVPELYIMNADGSEQTRLTYSPGFDIDPVWSPDGSQILFSSNRFGFFDIFLINADGTNERMLTETPAYDIAASWSPDGRRILFSSNREGFFNLYTMDSDGENVRQLTDGEFNEYYGSWCPRGRRITYVSTEEGEPHVYVMRRDGSWNRRISR